MTPTTITPVTNMEHAAKDAIGGAVINPDPTLGPDLLMSGADGAHHYVAGFRDALQAAGGTQAFAPDLSPEGALTLYLEAIPPGAISGQLAGASPAAMTVDIALVYTVSGAEKHVALTAETQADNIWKLTATVPGPDLAGLRTVLFDTVPSARLLVSRKLRMAAQLTESFVTTQWPNPTVRKGFLDTFSSAIPMNTPEQFYMFAQQAYPGYPSQFMVMDVTYDTEIPVPPLPGFIQWQLTYQNAAYNYYQDNQQLDRVFYLPDGFALAVEPSGGPTISLLKFETTDGTVENTKADFRFFGAPQVTFERINDAKTQLAAKIGQTPQMVSLQYAHGVESHFSLRLPNASGPGSAPMDQTQAEIDLDKGLRNEVILNFEGFQALWAAIFSDQQQQALFTGEVTVSLLGGKFVNKLAFNGRLPAGEQSSYFDRILDQGSNLTYATELTVNAPVQLFGDAIDPQILAISLDFGPNATVDLMPPSPPSGALITKTVQVQRSIEDIVLGKAATGAFSYTLKVVTMQAQKCCTASTSSTTVFITMDEVKKADGPCP